MDFSQVGPPGGGFSDPNSAFADALARARQIAAKISSVDGGGNDLPNDIQGLKRPLQDSFGGNPDDSDDFKNMPFMFSAQPEAKKPAYDPFSSSLGSNNSAAAENDPIGAQLRAIAEQQR
ncbi:far upstream element-binding protein 1-like isoform X1 [Lingula anatina]|nr:far upstream element-binding protein 1-like isoform X1 [Lingula anatina]|eukprot:XP_013405101.1 far upstream element-binding protein 1-like isoform X1 [Lingula anatina]